MSVLEFARPWILLLLPLPWVAWWLLPSRPPPNVLPVPFGVRDLLTRLTPSKRLEHHESKLMSALRVLGWVAIISGLAGPFTRGEPLNIPTGRDLIVAVDLSSSMEEQDMVVDGTATPRYKVVREQLHDFIGGRQGDRVALIAFGHEAFLVAPLTFDVDAVATTLEELAIGLPGHRTDLGRAVGLAVQSIRTQPVAKRVLVLLSDGEDNSGSLSSLQAAQIAKKHGITIHTIGFTSDLDADGARVLRDIAETSGGQFFAAETTADLLRVSTAIDGIEPVSVEGAERYFKRYWTPGAISLALVALLGLAWCAVRES